MLLLKIASQSSTASMSGIVCTNLHAKAEKDAREVKKDAPLQHEEAQAQPQDAVRPPVHTAE